MKLIRRQRQLRTSLFLSAAGLGLALAASPALAEDGDGLIDASQALREAHGGNATIGLNPAEAALEAYAPTGPQIVKVDPEPQIVIADPNTPTTARDPVNINGIGQMVVDDGGGFVGLCTGTLINPRTVIFAAHCVNSRAATAYGANSGGTPIAFGFETNVRANAAGQTDELVRWLLGSGASQTGRFQTNIAQAFYNANWLNYNPLSLEPAAAGFLYGDVAMASLDTPAANVPTWALLFSALPAPASIGAAGTGYNVGLSGYGRNGTGTTGAGTFPDYRRRAAENILGALTDLQTFEGFLFGGPPNGLTQNLYFIDFDDPRRGQLGASVFDFNAFRDNARTGTNGGASQEGLTSQGDSGGPLILQNFAQQLVIGVLSGGYTRFFGGQPANGYGTVAFYQPLYLYWDWIAANNPYHYVAAQAGDGAWTDPAHWVTTLDPAYMILANGQPVNGIPGLTGEQSTGTGGDFGQICFQSGGISDCYDTRTGVETIEIRPIGTDNVAENNAGSASPDEVAAGQAITRDDLIPGVQPEAQAAAVAIPAATLANGLPGATNFVPNNSEPVRAAGTPPRYFDVTLAQTGTTTLSGASIVIDRLTIGTAGAALVVASGASLTTLINTNHFAGTNTVNGTFTTVGDYSLFGGTVLGTGTINAPFLTSITGRIAPGTAGTVGTLTLNGSLILSSGSTYLVDLGATGSDLLAVRRVGGAGGAANVGGQVALSFTNALRGGQTYTILTAEGGVTGTFVNPASFSAILRPTLTYNATSVVLNVVAGNYTGVVSASNPTAYAYAQLLDQNRARASSYDALYGPLDLQNASTIVATLNGLAPASESTVQTLGFAAVGANANFIGNRLNGLTPGELGGTLAHYGRPVEVAAVGLSPFANGAVRSDAAPAMVQEGALPDTMSGFLSGGYLNGDGRSMTGMGGRDNFDGWYIGGGIEVEVGDNALVGFALSYTDLDGTASFAGQSVTSEAIQGTLYAKLVSDGGIALDGQMTAGALKTQSTRAVNFLGTAYTLRASDTALIYNAEVGIGKDFGGTAFAVTPRVAVRNTYIGFGSALESGGPMALDLRREAYKSVQGRAGLTLGSKSATVRPFVTGTYVHEFMDQPGAVRANLVGGTGPGVLFALNGADKDWVELSGGLTIKAGSVDLSLSADTTLERSDLSAQSYRGSITFRF